jgi:disulfide bond formation protein DsbB
MPAPARLYPALIALASAAVLAAAFGFQHLGGLDPCELCIWQRYPYGGTIAAAVLALIAPPGRAQAALLGLAAALFLAGAGIAAFHVGVEQHWWEGTAACGGAAPAGAGGLGALLDSLDRPPARCDEVAWSLFGISMAGYNFLISLALAAFSIWAARRLWSADA